MPYFIQKDFFRKEFKGDTEGKKPTGLSPEQSALADPALSRGAGRKPSSEVPSNHNDAIILPHGFPKVALLHSEP